MEAIKRIEQFNPIIIIVIAEKIDKEGEIEMRLVRSESGYDTVNETQFEAREYEYNGHSVEVTKDKYGIHIRVDGSIYKTRFHINPEFALDTVIQLIENNLV